MDQFPRFTRSEMVRKFLLKKGQAFTRRIAIDISKGYKIDLRFKPNHLNQKEINDNYIYFNYTLSEDTPDWELIYDKKGVETFISKTSYCFNNEKLISLQLAKGVFTLPFNIEDVWTCCWNTESIIKIEPLVFKNRKEHLYIPPTINSNDNLYGISLNATILNLLPGIKRTAIYSTTIVRDSEIDAILISTHTCSDCYNNEFTKFSNEYQNKEFEGFINWSLFKVNEKTTRVVIATYSEIKVPILSSFLYKKMAIKRSKQFKKSFLKVLNELTNNNTTKIDQTKLIDKVNFKKCLQDNLLKYPNRSWYKEWLNFKNIKNI